MLSAFGRAGRCSCHGVAIFGLLRLRVECVASCSREDRTIQSGFLSGDCPPVPNLRVWAPRLGRVS